MMCACSIGGEVEGWMWMLHCLFPYKKIVAHQHMCDNLYVVVHRGCVAQN